MDLFLARKILAALVLPPTGPLLVALIGLVMLTRYPRLGRASAWLGVLSVLLASLPVVSHGLLSAAGKTPPFDVARAAEAQAIVIIGGGIRRSAPEYGGETLGRLTLERVRYGAVVARETKLPILVSGGAVYGGVPEASIMKRALEEEFGVAVRWVEPRSRDTRTNAVYSAAILLPQGVKRIVLIAHEFDMRRASAEFASAGMQVTPAPTGVRAATTTAADHPVEWLPSMASLHDSYYALYELLGDAVRRMRAL